LGAGTLSYQWNVNGTNVVNGPAISGATNATLTLSNVQPAQAGNVFVVITNNAGSITSQVAALTVYLPPAITAAPQGWTKMAGLPASLSVTAVGSPSPVYQWYFNGQPLNLATNASLTFSPLATTNTGSYTVLVSNLYGAVISAPAVVTVTNPVITLSTSGVGMGMTPAGFGFQLSIPAGSTYVVLASTDMINWIPISTNVATAATTAITDATAAKYTRRFYRAQLQ
jgi:hypothetical protein